MPQRVLADAAECAPGQRPRIHVPKNRQAAGVLLDTSPVLP